jgi:hypothetical protein
MDYALNIYKTKLHLQPLPLFSLLSLVDRLAQAPSFLRSAFLALCLSYSSPEFPQGHGPESVQSYFRLGHEAVLRLAAEGTATLEAMQALCLLTMNDVIGCYIKPRSLNMEKSNSVIVGNPARAWMTIGIASRLQALRDSNHSQQHLDHSQEDEAAASRCYWSISMLERVFSPQMNLEVFGRRQNLLREYPPSAPCPQLLRIDTASSCDRPNIPDPAISRGTSGSEIKDLGINAYCVKFISIWGDLTTYLHEIQSGKAENLWRPSSTYAQLNFRMHEPEMQVATKHLFRNVSPQKRSAAELLEHQEYWAPWALMQVTSHAVPAILNHPFIQLVATRPRDSNRTTIPAFFIQQTVDLALFHAGWVAQLLRVFDNFPFEITNPVIGHLVAATATVFWLFQFVRDTTVSSKAKEDLEQCERFLERLSSKWPHIAQKVLSSRVRPPMCAPVMPPCGLLSSQDITSKLTDF